MDLQTFYGKGRHSIWWAHLRAARGTVTVFGIPHCINYCKIFIVCAQVTNVAAGLMLYGHIEHL